MPRTYLIVALAFAIGLGAGVLLAATPHEYQYDRYSATTLQASTTTLVRAAPHAQRTGTLPAPVPAELPKTYSFTATISGTALDAMRASGVPFTGKDYPGIGLFVTSIAGRVNTDNEYWFLYVNGTSSASGASATHISPGDIVEWRYEEAK